MAAGGKIRLDADPVLVVAWREGREIRAGRIEIGPGVAALFHSIADEHLGEVIGMRRRVYSPELDIERSEEIAAAPRSRLSVDDPILSLLERAADLDSISPAELPERNLLLYASVYPGSAMFLRKTNPLLSARRGHVLTRLRDTLTAIEEPVFDFDRKVDLVVTADEVLISSINAFDFLFKDDDFLTGHVGTWVSAISEALPLAAGSADFLLQRGLSNIRRRRRMESIAERGHLASVTTAQLRKEIKRLGLDEHVMLPKGRLIVNDDTIEDVLKLLNEDLFIGGLSGSPFEVDKKAKR